MYIPPNFLGDIPIYTYIHGHSDSMTDPAQFCNFWNTLFDPKFPVHTIFESSFGHMDAWTNGKTENLLFHIGHKSAQRSH